MRRRSILRVAFSTLVPLLLLSGPLSAATYEVRVTNVTKQQTFTPLLVVSHRPTVRLFEPGASASFELETLAEAGDIGPMSSLLDTLPGEVGDYATNGGLIPPGQTAEIFVEAGGPFDVVSFAGMLIPTNDTFVGADRIPLPRGNAMRRASAVAYDAGTELNDQDCDNIPGPRCMGEGLSPVPSDDDEGHVHVSNGFHDLGDGGGRGGEILSPFDYDWRNPVAYVSIRRVADAGDDEDEDGDE